VVVWRGVAYIPPHSTAPCASPYRRRPLLPPRRTWTPASAGTSASPRAAPPPSPRPPCAGPPSPRAARLPARFPARHLRRLSARLLRRHAGPLQFTCPGGGSTPRRRRRRRRPSRARDRVARIATRPPSTATRGAAAPASGRWSSATRSAAYRRAAPLRPRRSCDTACEGGGGSAGRRAVDGDGGPDRRHFEVIPRSPSDAETSPRSLAVNENKKLWTCLLSEVFNHCRRSAVIRRVGRRRAVAPHPDHNG
jgi:hypothetical protein